MYPVRSDAAGVRVRIFNHGRVIFEKWTVTGRRYRRLSTQQLENAGAATTTRSGGALSGTALTGRPVRCSKPGSCIKGPWPDIFQLKANRRVARDPRHRARPTGSAGAPVRRKRAQGVFRV